MSNPRRKHITLAIQHQLWVLPWSFLSLLRIRNVIDQLCNYKYLVSWNAPESCFAYLCFTSHNIIYESKSVSHWRCANHSRFLNNSNVYILSSFYSLYVTCIRFLVLSNIMSIISLYGANLYKFAHAAYIYT